MSHSKLSRFAVPAAIAAVMILAVLGAWSSSLGRAHAVGLKVGLDFNPTGTAANGVYNPAALPTFETCAEVIIGQTVSIDVYAEDVLQLVAFSADIQYNQALLRVNGANVSLFMGSQVGSNMVNDSTPVLPDTDGLFYLAGHEDGNISGDDGYGVLGRVTFQGVASGISTVTLPSIDMNSDSILDTGAVLRKADGSLMNDGNGDGFYDGPWKPGPGNPTGTIAVGHDNDGDGRPSNTCPGGPIDNCPAVNNPGQEDLDLDGLGDACDGDVDGDFYWTAQETNMGSSTTNVSRTPEICDGLDNDGDGAIDEGYDFAPVNGIVDCNDAAADTDGDGQNNTVDLDDDNDGLSDVKEAYIRTDTLRKCPPTTTSYYWWGDTNNNKIVNISDVLGFNPYFGGIANNADPAIHQKYNRRFDFNNDGKILISDVLNINLVFGQSCTV